MRYVLVGSVLAVKEESVYFQNFITEIDMGKCERKESLVSDLFYSSHIFSLNYYSYPFPVMSSSFDYPTSLQTSPLNIFQFQFFYLFP